MKLILKTHYIQIRRRIHTTCKHMPIVMLCAIVSVLILAYSSSLILKEMLLPVIEVINSFDNLLEAHSVLVSLCFSISAVVGVIMMLKFLISDSSQNQYLKMLDNYGVSLFKRQALMFISESVFLMIVSVVALGIIYMGVFVLLKKFKLVILVLLGLQLIWSVVFLQVFVFMTQIVSRFILKRWVSLFILAMSIYFAYNNMTVMNPLNLMAYFLYQKQSFKLFLSFIILFVLTVYALNFDLFEGKRPKIWPLFEILPTNVYFKSLKETLRLKDFWFNNSVLAIVGYWIVYHRAGLLNDPVILKMILIVPTMSAIYVCSQRKDSNSFYKMAKLTFWKVYLSGVFSAALIYGIQYLIMYLFVESLHSIIIDNLLLVMLSISVFRMVGFIFPLHYKDSKKEQYIVAALSLLIIPIVLVVLEIKKVMFISPMIENMICLILIVIINMIELICHKKVLYEN